jgi:SpoVK/Ycf46/Vps4 family AAA+-type ATPase
MRMGISASAGVLLYGPPGCAKTTLVRAFARFSQATFVSLAAADVFSPFVGAAEAVVRQAFARARQCSPCVIFIDEIDSLVGNRGEHTSEVNSRVLATLLNEMDGIDTSTSEDDRVIVVGATNRPWAIDAALLRPGRLDSLIFVGLPDDECRQRMTQMFLKTVPHERGEEIVQTVVRRTEGWTGAEVEQMLREAVFHSWRNSHATQIEPLLSLEDVLTAIAAVQPAVTNDVVGQYIRFADNRVS